MRLSPIVALALLIAACGSNPAPESVSPSTVVETLPATSAPATTTPVPTPTALIPSASPSVFLENSPSPTPGASPEPSFDPSLVATALAYATEAGFVLASDPQPVMTNDDPPYDDLVLRRVNVRLAHTSNSVLDVFLDDAGAIRVVDASSAERPIGPTASRAEVLRAAARYLRQIGVDPKSGTLHVAAGSVGEHWYLTFDRRISGYRVANAPMWWWLAGDKAYLELGPDSSIVQLYAIRPTHSPLPQMLGRRTLNDRLAKVARLSLGKLAKLDPAFLWVRPDDQTGAHGTSLSLAYCATIRGEAYWEGWCVDPATGARSASGSGVD